MKKIIILFLIIVSMETVFGQTLFNENLTDEEQIKLLNGEILIRNIGKAKNMCLAPVSEGTQNVIDIIDDLNPKYLAEVIQLRPQKGNENLLDELKQILLEIEDYVGIPYYSERNEQYYDLYSDATIISEEINENDGKVQADLWMDPFGNISVDIEFTQTEDDLLYTMTNTNKIKYKGITAVSLGNMQSIVYVFPYKDNLVLYGIGGVDAFRFPFLTERIEISFINRIKTFCQFIFEQL